MNGPRNFVQLPPSDRLDVGPVNVIPFPGQPFRKIRATRKPTSPALPIAGSNILELPEVAARSRDNVRDLIAETREILMRRSGSHAAMAIPRREFSGEFASRKMTLSEPLSAVREDTSMLVVVTSPPRNPMQHSAAQSQMAELFALKRREKPPENFLRDFIQEFHKRVDATPPKPRRSASRRKSLPD